VRHDGSSVLYEASNGRTYKIDVLDMIQLNLSKGTRRNVHRHQGHGKNWSMWQYEAERAEGRNYTHSKTTLVQYPKEVCIALEDRFRHVRAAATLAELEGAKAVDRQRAESAWRRKLASFNGQRLRDVFAEVPTPSPCEELCAGALASEASKDDGLREVLFEAVLRQHGWPPRCVADGIRWLRRKGLQLGAQHVRKATLLHGGLTPLRVLLMEMEPPLDVMGLEILVDHRCAVVTNGNTSGGGWVQRCKPALKALLARGAVLGSHSLQSRLLKRVEEDGMSLWVERVLESLRRCRPEVPDLVLSRIADFAGKGG